MFKNRKVRISLLAATLVVAGSLVSLQATVASTQCQSLGTSKFEIDTDANMKADDASGCIDWLTVNDSPQPDGSGPNDESFGQGTKEDTAVPTIVTGGIPPNKSDLKWFSVATEGSGSSGFVHMFWARVQDPSGTTNMDFEFNQEQASPNVGNGMTPPRTNGDLLITYDLAKGGTVPEISL